MHRLFRNYGPFSVLVLIIFAFLAKLQALSHPVAPTPLPDHIFFASLLRLLDEIFEAGAFGYTLLAVINLVGQALFLNYIAVRHRLFVRNSYFPAYTYILLSSLNPSLNYFSEPLLINWLLLIALNIMLTLSQTTHPRKQIFNAGFVLCLPVLVQFPAIGFLLLFIASLILLRSFNFGEWVVGLMGYLTPVYFFVCILFLTDNFHLIPRLPELGFSVPKNYDHPLYRTGSIVGQSILALVGIIAIQQLLPKVTISIRRSWLLVVFYFIVSLLVTFVAVSAVNAEWLIVLPSLSLVIAQAFCLEKTKRFSNFVFYFSLALLIFCQLTLNR